MATALSAAPTAMATALSPAQYYEYADNYNNEDNEDDDDVSYGVALVSCVLSLAVGFGTGYLV